MVGEDSVAFLFGASREHNGVVALEKDINTTGAKVACTTRKEDSHVGSDRRIEAAGADAMKSQGDEQEVWSVAVSSIWSSLIILFEIKTSLRCEVDIGLDAQW